MIVAIGCLLERGDKDSRNIPSFQQPSCSFYVPAAVLSEVQACIWKADTWLSSNISCQYKLMLTIRHTWMAQKDGPVRDIWGTTEQFWLLYIKSKGIY